MLIYAVRHGQTEMNCMDIVSGITDVPLTEEGKNQALTLAQRLRKEAKIEKIIASPLLRAVQTAEIIASAFGLAVETDERLREQNYGIYEGKSRLAKGFLENKRQFAFCYPEGESHFLVCQRVYNFLDDTIQRNYPKNLLLVTHGGVLRVLRSYFQDMNNEEYFSYNAENTSVEVYDISSAKKKAISLDMNKFSC